MPGAACAAMCTSTSSPIDDASTRSDPNVRAAHAMISLGWAPSRSRPACSARARSSSVLSSVTMLMTCSSVPRIAVRRPVCTTGTPTRRASRPRGTGPRWRRRGSSREPLAGRARSSQVLLSRALGPLGEQLALGALLVEPARDALDVVGQLLGRNAQAAQGLPEPARQAQATAEVHLVPVLAARESALETDVGRLNARARVGAAVEVDRDRLVERGQPVLE